MKYQGVMSALLRAEGHLKSGSGSQQERLKQAYLEVIGIGWPGVPVPPPVAEELEALRQQWQKFEAPERMAKWVDSLDARQAEEEERRIQRWLQIVRQARAAGGVA
jgi:hypothetical protein